MPGTRDTTGNMTQSCGAYTLSWRQIITVQCNKGDTARCKDGGNQTKVSLIPDMGKGNSQGMVFWKKCCLNYDMREKQDLPGKGIPGKCLEARKCMTPFAELETVQHGKSLE